MQKSVCGVTAKGDTHMYISLNLHIACSLWDCLYGMGVIIVFLQQIVKKWKGLNNFLAHCIIKLEKYH